MPAPTETKERLVSFRAGHTESAVTKRCWKLGNQRSIHLGDSLIGDAIHTPTVASIPAPALVNWGLLDALPHTHNLEEMAQDMETCKKI